jgi:hypothetical protein
MSKIKKFTHTGAASFLETFSDVTNNPQERLQLEARLAAMTEASTAAQATIQAHKIDWQGPKLEGLMEMLDGLVRSGKVKVANDSELARYVSSHYLYHGKPIPWQSARTCLIRSRRK